MFSSRKYSYLPMEIPRGRGVAKATNFKEMYGAKLTFPEGWSANHITFHGGSGGSYSKIVIYH